ncbi:MAG: putative RDD family membrane protein YckC [Alcanivorax sp.]|jgi:uncharacterized RDD family membrane protein YckC
MLLATRGETGTVESQEYAGFWIRLGAASVDSLLFLLVVSVPLTLIYGSEYWGVPEAAKGFWDVMIQYVAPVFITVWFWIKYLGTPGKMAFRLRVVDARTGQALSTPQAVGRYFGYYVSILPLMLGFIWVGIDKRKQGFHDKLAGTVVIRDLSKGTVQFER